MYTIYATLNHHYIRPHMEHFTLESQSVFLTCFEAWANWIDNRLVCVPLGIHLELINKQLMLLVIIIIIIINSTIWPKERTVLCQIRSSIGQWCELIINSGHNINYNTHLEGLALLHLADWIMRSSLVFPMFFNNPHNTVNNTLLALLQLLPALQNRWPSLNN